MGRFYERLQAQWDEGKFVCVGLDPDADKIFKVVDSAKYGYGFPGELAVIQEYLIGIVSATFDVVAAYKPNWAFFLRYGSDGLKMMENVIRSIRDNYPQVMIILDMKSGDIGNTNLGYVQYALGVLGVDAVTVHPYMGHVAMKPFLDQDDCGVIVLVRTSNEGAGELQDLYVHSEMYEHAWTEPEDHLPLHLQMVKNVRELWNYNDNCAVVVGATAPNELRVVRGLVGDDIPILIPGVGAQGGDLELAVQNGKNSRGDGFIINASRSVLYASSIGGRSPAKSARGEVVRMNKVIRQTLFVPSPGNDV